MSARLQRLRAELVEHGLDGVIITKPENRRYFSGFTGSAGMLWISGCESKLLTDFRYIEQAAAQAAGYEIRRHGSSIYATLDEVIKAGKHARVGFESDAVTVDVFQQLCKSVPDVQFTSLKLDHLRQQKDEAELACIRKAVRIADQAFTQILTYIRPGIREYDVAVELEYVMRKLGSEKPAFDTIVASGKRGALPHGQPSDRILAAGDMITMDFGAVYQGYHSDMTRTVVLGKASGRQKEIYETVLAAQLKGVASVRPGLTGKEADAQSRRVIEKAGFGDYFGHGLGHSVGLVIHEEPRLSPYSDAILRENMIVTVEPGIYIPDWGGVRIEDMVVVTPAGCEILTASSKQLIELDV